MSRVENHLRPRGRPQERVLNPIVPFAVNHGLDWIARLGERIDVAPRAGFRIVDLGESFTGEKEES
jgi:hypothetical protein